MAAEKQQVTEVDRSLYDFVKSEEGYERLDAGLTSASTPA